MKKIVWVNFLHIYQPPWQQRGVIEQAAIESYEYLFTLLRKYHRFRATLNITGSLIEQLAEIRPDLLKSLQALVKKGDVELTASAKYHALLPLLPESEIRRQINLNQEVLSKYFRKKIKGFYLPEMAYSKSVAKIIKELGFKWLILDPITYAGQIDNNILYQIKDIGLQVVFRNRKVSKSYPAEIIYKKFKHKNNRSEIIISATDGELYGHFHEDWQGHLEKILQNDNLQVNTIGQYFNSLKNKEIINLRTAGWETTEQELKKKIPFALWQDPKNKIHQTLWQLTKAAIDVVNKYPRDKNFYWARRHLDRGLASCTFWWASAKKPSQFSPLSWNPDAIDNGSEELVRSVRSLVKASVAERLKVERLYIKTKKITWETHWRKYN